MKKRLCAEWEQQSAVQFMFPHSQSDWNSTPNGLKEMIPVFEMLAKTVAKYQTCLITYQEEESVKGIKNYPNIILKQVDSNDTWCRDFGAISLVEPDSGNQIELLDFTFNGWGGKFDAALDNQVSSKIFNHVSRIEFILEGGSIDVNTHGVVLTTTECLLNSNRHTNIDKAHIEAQLKKYLHAQKIIWLEHGALAGDDTDSHIDMLARFVNDTTIVYTTASPDDENYAPLKAMEEELKTLEKEGYTLIPLPAMPKLYDEEGNRLPSSYANFLIINGAVLLPIYNDVQDEAAIKLMQELFPDRKVEAIDCSKVVEQGGSLHCLSMQYYHEVE